MVTKPDEPTPLYEGQARIEALEATDDGGIAITFSATTSIGQSDDGSLVGFDPWNSTLKDALQRGMHSAAFAKFAAAQSVLGMRQQIEAGDGLALLNAVAAMGRYGLVMPQWLVDDFIARLLRVQRFECPSLDEAFGHERPNPRKLSALGRRRRMLPLVASHLSEAMRADPARPIDKGLFEQVGKELGIGATDCERLYRQGIAAGKQDLKSWKRFLLAAGKKSRRKT